MNEPRQNKGGRPAFEPTDAQRRQVKAMAAYGVPEFDIAKVIGIAEKTLRKHFWQELETGHIEANAKVAESLFQKAMGNGQGAVTAAIFWLKCRAGWREDSEADKRAQAEAASQTAVRGTNWEALLQ